MEIYIFMQSQTRISIKAINTRSKNESTRTGASLKNRTTNPPLSPLPVKSRDSESNSQTARKVSGTRNSLIPDKQAAYLIRPRQVPIAHYEARDRPAVRERWPQRSGVLPWTRPSCGSSLVSMDNTSF